MIRSPIASVVLDVDSTLCGVEGIDWLARFRGDDVAARVAELTERSMQGDIPLDAVYGERLALVKPTRDDIDALAKAYIDELAPGSAEAISLLRHSGKRVVVVSGGVREAILPVARLLGIREMHVHAVSLQFDGHGAYVGFDASSPLTTAEGKRSVVAALRLPTHVLAMGDGMTDLAMKGEVDVFAAYTGFVFRESVVAGADLVFESFDQLTEYVLS